MSLPPLANSQDIVARAPELMATIDFQQAEALLEDASAIVRAFADCEWVNDDRDELEDVPDGIPGITALMVIRALRVPEGVTQEQIGNYSVSYSPYASDRLYLTRTDKAFIRKVSSGSSGAFSIDTYGAAGYLGQTEDEDWTL